MKKPLSNVYIIIGALTLLVIFFSRCLHGNALASPDLRGDRYAGAATCVRCHQAIAQTYAHTGHYHTSSPIDRYALEKLIPPTSDKFYFGDSSYIRFEKKGDTFFQSNFVNEINDRSQSFDLAFGSAAKAQTYGSWKEKKIYQLPLTYFTDLHIWANSPGFSVRQANFDREIISHCFDCHASNINTTFERSGPLAVTENLDSNSIIYGIDCERCHGPAAAHVEYHTDNPAVRTAKFISPIRSLTRQQQLDVCGVCHSGNDRTAQRPLLGFVPGDTLSHFYYPDFGAGNTTEPDVHGKQLQLLQSSQCFRNTTMTCTSCHDAHAAEMNDPTLSFYNAKCMECHQHATHKTIVSNNCIDCHMPLQASRIINPTAGANMTHIPYLIRTHRIAIYKHQ